MTTSSIGPGTVLGGRYRLDDLLSESDGARFWRGTDTVLARNVAIHALPTRDPRAGDLLGAARRSATVIDPHLLRVLDCDDEDGVTWVVNEWGNGASLDVMLERGTLPASRAAWLTLQVAEAIAAAHDAGVCHGRLTPECVLVTEAGAVKLIGFVVHSAIQNGVGRASGYGNLDDRERDVIDLAGILYAGLTGKWPGVSPSGVPTAPRDGKGPLRPRQVRAGVPRDLDAVCERVLRREAHEHTMPIETAQEIVAALSDFVGEGDAVGPDGPAGMHSEPTVAIRRDQIPMPPPAPAPAAPQQALEDTQLAELPPFEEHPDRPLFASTERRQPSPIAERGTDAWLYGDHGSPTPPATHEDEPDEPSPARRWLRIALLVGIVIVVLAAMALAFNVGRGKTETTGHQTNPGKSTTTPTLRLVKAVSVRDFDPEGDPPSENPSEVPLAVDGNPSTGWRTSTYRGNPALGGLKDGVGLLLDLGADKPVRSVAVSLLGQPTTLQLYATPTGVSDPPAQISDLQRVGGQTADGSRTTFRLDPSTRTRFLVVWLTRLPSVAGGYRGEVTEVAVRAAQG